MPKGPKKESSTDVIGSAIKVAKITTGEIEKTPRQMTAGTPPLYVWGGGAKRRATSATTSPRLGRVRFQPNAALMRPDHGQCSADFDSIG